MPGSRGHGRAATDLPCSKPTSCLTLLQIITNYCMGVHSASVFPFVFLRKHQPGTGVCSQSRYLQSSCQWRVLLSASAQGPEFFRRIFEDYLIIQSAPHVLTLTAWHIKKEEGRNDLSEAQTRSRSRSKWAICHLEGWGCFEAVIWKSCLDPAGINPPFLQQTPQLC